VLQKVLKKSYCGSLAFCVSCVQNGGWTEKGWEEKMMAAKETGKQQVIKKGEVAEVPSKQRLNLLITLFLALCALFLWLLRTTPEGQRWLASWQANWQARRNAALNQQRFQEALKNDPPLGFPLEKVGIENLAESELPILLVVLGRCEGCNEKVVYEWAEMGKWETLSKAVRFVLILQEGLKKVDEIGRDAKGVSLVADEGGEIARRLNAFFVPRAYGFEDGKLVWVQREGNLGGFEILERFFEAVKGREKAWLLIDAWSREMREKAWGKSLVSLEKGVDKR
jgi:hypothetical protein